MRMLVDYACDACGGRGESWIPSPPAPTLTCPACQGQARRLFAPVGLGGRASRPGAAPTTAAADPLCVRNPTVPGICHLDPDSARTWVARARRDNRSLERELARQEKAVAANPNQTVSVGGHHHGPGGHGHGHPPTAGHAPGCHE